MEIQMSRNILLQHDVTIMVTLCSKSEWENGLEIRKKSTTYLCECVCVSPSLTSGQTPLDSVDTCVLDHCESKDVHYSCPYAATESNSYW